MTEQEKISRKVTLKKIALDILHKRIEHASLAMNEAQLSANEEGKSSVGDKYETGRAMAQNDRDIYARQMENFQKELSYVQQVDVRLFHNCIEPGALMETETEKYFFLTGIGPMSTEFGNIFFLSLNSPLGKAFLNKKKGEQVIFNGRKMVIKEIS